MSKSEIKGFEERIRNTPVGLKEILAVIDMTMEERPGNASLHSLQDVLEGLDQVIGRTVHGATIERFRPRKDRRPFHTLEIHTEGGEVLGYLNMVYLRKPIPCHYLVYVEVLSPFRGRGLGQKILKAFKAFTEEKGSVGLLDNIIPLEDPTCDIYAKLGWKPIEDVTGERAFNGGSHYMVSIPGSLNPEDVREKLVKLLFKINAKRPIIEMHDNEAMVKRTISEFRSVHQTLERLFEKELSTGTPNALMHFMFTKFVTKVLGFQRRIASLLGYTGGESLEQISFSEQVRSMPIQPYSLWGSGGDRPEVWGDKALIETLPGGLLEEPTLTIEALPLYRRPYLSSSTDREEEGRFLHLKIRDLLELTFDPTKLREFRHEGAEYIFERISPHFLPCLERRRTLFHQLEKGLERSRFHHTPVHINPPLAVFRDRGNVYVLRRKLEGIHLEEALDQLRNAPHLKEMNRVMGIDRLATLGVREIRARLRKAVDSSLWEEIEELAFFISWNLQENIPRLVVDPAGISMATVWIS